MSFAAGFDVKEAVRQKENLNIMRITTIRMTIPAGETVTVSIAIPKLYVWFIVGDVHDVPIGVFRHRCVKDGTEVLNLVVHADTMVMGYPIPYICEYTLDGEFTNLTATDERFKLTIFYSVMSRDYHTKLVNEIKFEDEVKQFMAKIWEEMTPSEQEDMVRRWMKGTIPMLVT